MSDINIIIYLLTIMLCLLNIPHLQSSIFGPRGRTISHIRSSAQKNGHKIGRKTGERLCNFFEEGRGFSKMGGSTMFQLRRTKKLSSPIFSARRTKNPRSSTFAAERTYEEPSLVPGHALHEKGLQIQIGVVPLVGSQEQRALLVPVINR